MLCASRHALQHTKIDARRSFSHLCVDIFPICTSDLPILQRSPLGEQVASEAPSSGGRGYRTPSDSAPALIVPPEILKTWKITELRNFIQKRGWSDIPTSGAGRTTSAIREDVLQKMCTESLPANTNYVDQPRVQVTHNGICYATSEDLSLCYSPEWKVPKTPVPSTVSCNLAAELFRKDSWQADESRCGRRVRWASYDIDLIPKFNFRGRMLGDQPCVDVMLSHVAKPPPELNVLAVCGKQPEAAKGLHVRTLPGRQRGEIVEYVGKLGAGMLREKLLACTKTEASRMAIANADDSMPVFKVRIDRFGRRSAVELTYLGSMLQPSMTPDNVAHLDRIMGQSTGYNLGTASFIAPKERKRLIDEEFDRIASKSTNIASKLCGKGIGTITTGLRRVSSDFDAWDGRWNDRCTAFPVPGLVVGNNQIVRSHGGNLWSGLQKHGLYKYEPNIGKRATIRGYVLGSQSSPQDLARAHKYASSLIGLLQDVHITSDKGSMTVVAKSTVAAALDDAEREGAHAVILFSTARTGDWYHDAKGQCLLQRKAPGLSHLASQWVNLARNEHQRPALLNIALQLLAKLGHTPYVLESSHRFRSASKSEPVLCGLDVCHLPNPRTGQMTHVTAGLQLRQMNGEVEHAWLCQGSISGESIPPWIWQKVVSKEACAGREVIIHRDGRFTDHEKQFLAEHAQNIEADGPFGLVEIVKYAAGTPRMYVDDENTQSGAFFRLSDTECLLTSGTYRNTGTRNPLLIRSIESRSGGRTKVLPIELAAEDVFRLGMISYGNLYATPRLPVTTKAADKAAYFHASCEVPKAKKNDPDHASLTSHGTQQYWL